MRRRHRRRGCGWRVSPSLRAAYADRRIVRLREDDGERCDAALAIPDPVTGIDYGEGIYSGPQDFGLGADDPVGALLMAPFVALANVLTGVSITLVKGTASTSILTAQFDQIAPNVLGIMQGAHRTVVIPVANVVASVVFVAGLVKLLANSSAYRRERSSAW